MIQTNTSGKGIELYNWRHTNLFESPLVPLSWYVANACPQIVTGGSRFTAQRIEEAKHARETVEEIADLLDDWDGYGAASISSEARIYALRFIDIIEAMPGLPIPEVSPTPAGTISFEWDTEDFVAYLEIGTTRYSGYVKVEEQEHLLMHGQASYLDQQVLLPINLTFAARASALTSTRWSASFCREWT